MEPFERRVSKEMWGFIWDMGYKRVPIERKKRWLQEHFFLPGGWPECQKIACIKSVSRVQKFCWQALSDTVTFNLHVLKPGRPKTSIKRRQTIYLLLHKDTPIRAEWQWPLINLAFDKTKLVPTERLWLTGRPGVLPLVFARLFCLELAVFCANFTGLHQGYVDGACDIIKMASTAGTVSPASIRGQLIKALPEHPATLVFLEVMGGRPAVSIRKTLAQTVRTCTGVELEVFANLLYPVIMERAV